MKTEIRKKQITVDETVYIAFDGKEFKNYAECLNHETASVRYFNPEDFEVKDSMNDVTPLDGGEYMEYHTYRWIKPKTMNGVDRLNKILHYGNTFNENTIGCWICLEITDDNEVYDTLLDDSIRQIKWFLDQFGYDVTITERKDNE